MRQGKRSKRSARDTKGTAHQTIHAPAYYDVSPPAFLPTSQDPSGAPDAAAETLVLRPAWQPAPPLPRAIALRLKKNWALLTVLVLDGARMPNPRPGAFRLPPAP